jgi:glucose-6-phosphate 1-dehydrogenase
LFRARRTLGRGEPARNAKLLTVAHEYEPGDVAASKVVPLDPHVIILFGATGDLSRRKLIPGLLHLTHAGLMPEFRLVGTALGAMTDDEFRTFARDAWDEFGRTDSPEDSEDWQRFSSRLSYVDLNQGADALAEKVHAAETDLGGHPRRLHYLSVPPAAATSVIDTIRDAGLTERARVIMEKPFGTDLASAKELNARVQAVFPEEQVYRIDHFLGKEAAQNILALRFANGLFEPIWNRHHIDHIQIDVPETLAVGSRAAFYEGTGAFRDMVVTHLFQVLAFTAMEPPTALAPGAIGEEKTKVFRSLQPIDPEQVVRGQYEGYRAEPGVDPESETETFIALRCEIDNWRWSGVPFFLRTGKRLSRKTTEIAVQLKPVPHLAFASDGSVGVQPNLLILAVQPNEGVSLSLGAKIPGSRMRIRPVNMEFLYGSSFMSQSPEAYERLIQDAMRGEATLFTRDDEVIAQWSIIDPILKAWKENQPAKSEYAAGSPGPPEADELIAPRKWRGL